MTAALPLIAAALIAAVPLSYLLVCSAVAWRFTTARRRAPAAGGAGETVHFAARAAAGGAGAAAKRLAATYLAAPDARGAVVFVHGKDACRGDELKLPTFTLAQQLMDCGFSVLMLDLRGHGASGAARLTYGERERYDVLGAVDWLRARGHQRIGVLGASMGASTSLMAAADEPAINALVADSAFADFGQMIERQYHRLSHLPGCFLPGALLLGRLLTGVDLRRVSPLAAARSMVGRPVLVIHSLGDRFVPAADAIAIARDAGAELWITDTPGHIGSYRAAPDAYTQRVVGFFCSALQPLGPAGHSNA